MAADVGAFALVAVINVREVLICDFCDLTDPSGWRRTPHIVGGVAPRIKNGIDIPVSIVTNVGIVILKIGVIREHLIGRPAVFIVITRATLSALAMHHVSVSE